MSRTAQVTLRLGDRAYRFALRIGELEELQELTDHGPEMIHRRLGDGSWPGPAFIIEPLRLGLVGAGMDPAAAEAVLAKLAVPGLLWFLIGPARAVLAAALVGAPDEDEPSPSVAVNGPAPLENGKIRFGAFYENAGAMGLSPADVAASSLWRFQRASDGWRKANSGSETVSAPTVEQFDEMLERDAERTLRREDRERAKAAEAE